MGNAPSKSEPKSGKFSTYQEAPKVPVREETEPTKLPSIPTEDHEFSSDDKQPHPEPSFKKTPITGEHQVSPLKVRKKTPNGDIHGQDGSQDGQDLDAGVETGTTTPLQRQNSVLTDEAIEVRDVVSAYNDATAERPGDSKDSSNVDNTSAEERPQNCCADGRRDMKGPNTSPSESTVLWTEVGPSGPRHSTEAASEAQAQSHQKPVCTLNLTSPQKVSISSAPSKLSSSKFLSENSNLPLPTRQVSEKSRKTAWSASLLRVLPSYSMDMTIGADAFRMPEMMEQSSTQSFRYKADAERTLQMRSERIHCQPSCAFCRKATSNIGGIVKKDKGTSKNIEVKTSTVDPADDLNSGYAGSDIETPSSSISKETPTHLSSETAVVSVLPKRTLHPEVTNECASPSPIRDQGTPGSHLKPASSNSEQVIFLRASLKSSRQFDARGSNAFDLELPARASGRIDLREAIEDAAGRVVHAQRNANTFTWSSLDDPLLLRNILHFIKLVVASRRPMLSFALADEHGIELQLHNLVQGGPNEYHGNLQVHSSLDGLPYGTQRSERFGPQTMSPPQQPSSLRSASLSHSKVDSLLQKVRSFLQQVQQLSLQVENFPQQVQTVLEEVKTFQQRAEHFKHEIDSVAQEVPNSQTRAPFTALQMRSFDELLHSFASIVNCFARLIQTISQQLNYSVQKTKENAASKGAQGHSEDGHRFEETQAVQGKGQSSPQRDGNSGQNEHILAQHGHTFTQQAHFYHSLKSRLIQPPINTPVSRYSSRSQRRNSPQEVDVNVVAKQARGGFPRGFGSSYREPRDSNHVEAHATGNCDLVPRVEKSLSKTSQTEPSRNPPTPPGVATAERMTSSSRENLSSVSSTPPPLADAVIREESSALGQDSTPALEKRPVEPLSASGSTASENQCSSQSGRVAPHHESPAKGTSPKDLPGIPSESGEQCIPPEASGVTVQPSPSRHPEASAEDVQSSKVGSPTSPNALVQLWRSFSIKRKRARKDRKAE